MRIRKTKYKTCRLKYLVGKLKISSSFLFSFLSRERPLAHGKKRREKINNGTYREIDRLMFLCKKALAACRWVSGWSERKDFHKDTTMHHARSSVRRKTNFNIQYPCFILTIVNILYKPKEYSDVVSKNKTTEANETPIWLIPVRKFVEW